jgi:hypothetical protein
MLGVYCVACGAAGTLIAWLASLCVSGVLAQAAVFSTVAAVFTVACALWFIHVEEGQGQ